MIRRFMYLLLTCSILVACKKNDAGSGNGKKQRIRSISDGSSAQIFEYDNERRITRLYYNASYSLKFSYSPAGVNIQRLGSGDIPDPDRKYDFSIVNGRITNGTEYQPDKRTRRFNYNYDEAGRMIHVGINLQYDGNTYETHRYTFEYDDRNNVKQVDFVRRDNGGLDNSDSISISKGYYDRKFITWSDMGFDFFGTASAGQEHLGYGIVVPFSLASSIYPGSQALKGETSSRYYWNPVTKKWALNSTNSFTRNEADYTHDAGGRLTEYFGHAIEWQ